MKKSLFLIIITALIFCFPAGSYATISPITGTTTVCVGLTKALTDATTGGTWSSSSGAVAVVGSGTGLVTGLWAGTATITYTVGSSYVTTVVTINPNPTAITGSLLMCNGWTTNLSSTTTGGTWSSSDSAVATVGSSGIVTSLSAGVSVITYTITGGCMTTAVVTVSPHPSVIAGPASVCATESIALFDSLPGGTWSSSNSNVTVNSVTGNVTGVIPGTTAIVTYTLPTGCIATKTITVNGISSVISGPHAVCLGSNITLSSSVSGGTWNSSIPAIAIVGSTTGIVTGVANGMVVISYNKSGCSETDTIDVGNVLGTVVNNPSITCTGPDFYVSACGISSTYNVTSFYGDGTSDNIPLTATSVCHASVIHTYAAPGTYSVKQVLYNGTAPLDSASFSYEYFYCRFLPVKFYYDANSDCIMNSEEHYNTVPVDVVIDSNGIIIDTVSVTSGIYYEVYGTAGTVYGFRVLPRNFVASCIANVVVYDTIQALVNDYPIKYYGLGCNTTAYDLAVTDAAPVTGPNDQIGYIYVWNNNCDTTDGTVTVYYDKRYSSSFNMRGGSMAPVSQTDSSATWTVNSLSSARGAVELNYQVWAPGGSLASGDTVYSRVTVSPATGDLDISNNMVIIRDTINDCEDPNQIFVSPTGCLPDTATQLQYTILFTNVGTDTAFNVSVMDTLPNTLDPKSLRLVMASNTMNIAQYNEGGNNIVKFDFPGINLLDTGECRQCSGEVAFTINTLAGLPEGTKIFNHAGVYFDYNPVVLTDTVANTMGGCIPASVNNTPKSATGNVSIFPNPTTTQLSIIMSPSAYTSFTITNSIGQDMIQQTLTTTQTTVNVATLPPGLYYITFRGDNGTTVQKFVKM